MKSVARLMWRLVSKCYLRPKGYISAAELLEHSLQNHPSDLNFTNGDRITKQVVESQDWQNLMISLINDAKANGQNEINVSTTGRFTDEDLDWALHQYYIDVSGRLKDNIWDLYVEINDIYDFAFNTKYGKEWRWRFATAGIKLASLDQAAGVVVPYNVTIGFNVCVREDKTKETIEYSFLA